MPSFSVRATTSAAVGIEVIAVGVGTWLTPMGGYIVAALGLLFFVPAIKEWLAHRKTRKLQKKDEPEFISMRDAATQLYSEARARQASLAKSVETLSGEDIVGHMAIYLGVEIPIWGKKPPSTLYERISKDEIKQMTFEAGSVELHKFFKPSAEFTDLQVKSTDLEKVIADLKTGEEDG